MRKLWEKVNGIMRDVSDAHVGAYAAQSAYFLILSLIPFILLLLTLVQYTPVTKADVILAVKEILPKSVNATIISIVEQVYNQSRVVIPVTLITALWSAGKGVMSMSAGLNSIYGNKETRNYVLLRIRGTFYTVAFILLIVVTLVLLVFGNSISLFVKAYIPIFSKVTDFIVEIRTAVTLVLLVGISLLIYKFLPNHKPKMRTQLPGALFNAVGWLFVSFVFSVYLDVFKGFESMYGSLTTIVLIMLWVYFCMYCMLLGGELNKLLADRNFLETKQKS